MFETDSNIAGWSSLVARRAHNPKVVWFKSRPRNHNKNKSSRICDCFCFCCRRAFVELHVVSVYEPGERGSLGEVASASCGRRSERNEVQRSKRELQQQRVFGHRKRNKLLFQTNLLNIFRSRICDCFCFCCRRAFVELHGTNYSSAIPPITFLLSNTCIFCNIVIK